MLDQAKKERNMSYYLYAGYPDAKVIDCNHKEIQHLLWGDWVHIKGPQRPDGYYPVYVRGENGWVHEAELQEERLLEVVFVDVGQGDGCLVVTPEDKHIVIDAGDGDNMYRFLNWRYAGFKNDWTFEFAIITHPDKDHYNGFFPLFEHENVNFKTVYHNGIMEEYKPKLGPVKKIGKQKYLKHLVETKKALCSFLNQKDRWQNKSYSKLFPRLMNTALTSGRVNDIRMISTEHSQDGYVPRYGVDKDLSLQILGPVVERDEDQKLLRAFGYKPSSMAFDAGKTKNGHSVVLLLKYRDIRVLLGGDLNKSAEDFLLRHYSGIDARYPYSAKEEDQIVSSAQTVFGCDIAKVCHHGSADVTDAMLRSISPAAAVVSSGDNESHAHPSRDTGRIRPLWSWPSALDFLDRTHALHARGRG